VAGGGGGGGGGCKVPVAHFEGIFSARNMNNGRWQLLAAVSTGTVSYLLCCRHVRDVTSIGTVYTFHLNSVLLKSAYTNWMIEGGT